MNEISQQLKAATTKLESCSIPLPHFEAELLLSLATGKSREEILAHPETELSDTELQKFKGFVARRAKDEPFSHISGEKEFMGLSFTVTPDTLIPRPETEQIIEEAVKTVRDIGEKKILIADIGTGSGCIAISTAVFLQKENLLSPEASIVACDFSGSALEICKQNIIRHSLKKNISTFSGDLLAPITKNNLLDSKEVLVTLANLPYLSEEIYLATPKTVQEFEPKSALYSPEDGLFHYKKMLGQLLEIKKNNSDLEIFALLEISPEQKESLSTFVTQNFDSKKTKMDFFLDLAGKWRLAKIEIK